MLVRSLTHALDTLPHTGSLRYKEGVDKLPAAAISTVDASALAKLHREASGTVQVKMRLNSQDLGTVEQGNVVGEWRGSEFPDEIITLGGHLDSWDIGEGAHDDGSGVVHTLEALRALKAIGYTPRRTCGSCCSSTKKTGTAAASATPQWRPKNTPQDCGMSLPWSPDAGGFVPRGVRMDAPDEGVAMVRSWAETLEPYNLTTSDGEAPAWTSAR